MVLQMPWPVTTKTGFYFSHAKRALAFARTARVSDQFARDRRTPVHRQPWQGLPLALNEGRRRALSPRAQFLVSPGQPSQCRARLPCWRGIRPGRRAPCRKRDGALSLCRSRGFPRKRGANFRSDVLAGRCPALPLHHTAWTDQVPGHGRGGLTARPRRLGAPGQRDAQALPRSACSMFSCERRR